jgi:polar amino acid transport system substrate-binding protein
MQGIPTMAIRRKIRRLFITAFSTVATVMVAGALSAPAQAADVLRVCADPDNLPFSKSEGPERGMYVELAEMVGQRMGASVEYVWWLSFNQRKALRNTILQDGCDAYFALPLDADYKVRGLQRTQAFIDVSYTLVAPPSLTLTGLADLKGKRIAVLIGSPPHILLSQHEGFISSSFRVQEDALDALAKGEVDAALLWGPSAGYENMKRFQGRWRVTPVSGQGMGGQMAVAVRADKTGLTAGIDKALLALQPDIAALAAKYGFPLGKPVSLALSGGSLTTEKFSAGPADGPVDGHALRPWLIKTAEPVKPAAAAAPDSTSGSADVSTGRSRFNTICSHCHGSNGASPVSERDLRKLKLRYKELWRETALKTIQEGRPDAGMPSWKSTYNTQEIDELLGFLSTIQK